MDNTEQNIVIYKNEQGNIDLDVHLKGETVWINRRQMADLFNRDIKTIGKHVNNVFNEGELEKTVVVAKFATTTQHGVVKGKVQTKQVEYYNLDVIISVGYRVKSPQGVKFRRWATERLKDYLVKGYAINEKRLQQKEQEVKHLKTGIQILNRAIEAKNENEVLNIFAKGLQLLDDYDHEELDNKGKTEQETFFPEYDGYIKFIGEMYSDFESDVFAKPKDDSFHSSINQIRQSFDGQELYPTIEEKAANLRIFHKC